MNLLFCTKKEIHIIYTTPESLYEVKEALEQMGVEIEKAEISYIPTTTVKIEDPATAEKLIKFFLANN